MLAKPFSPILLVFLFWARLCAQDTLPVAVVPSPTASLASGEDVERDLAEWFALPEVEGPLFRFETTRGAFDVELLPEAAPAHAENFAAYVEAEGYDNTFFHRVAFFENAFPSILQGGGYFATLPVTAVPALPPVALEYALPNARGTLAAARTASPDSATSQWYFNTRDNSNILGPNSTGPGYTVFGRVLGTGMTVVDALAASPFYNLGGAFSATPLRDVSPEQTELQIANFIVVERVRRVPLFPEAAEGPAALRFSLGAPSSGVVSASLRDGRFLVLEAKGAGSAEIEIVATDIGGNQARATLLVTVGKRTQAIEFPPIADRVYHPTNSQVPLVASADSGLPVSYEVEDGFANVSGAVLDYWGAGEIRVTARQAGDDTFAAAEPVTRSFVVARAPQTLSLAPLPLWVPPHATPISVEASTSRSGGRVHVRVSGPGVLTERSPYDFGYGLVMISPIGWSTYRGEITLTKALGLLTLTAYDEGDANYLPAEITHIIQVGRPQTIRFPVPPARSLASPSITLRPTASSRLPVGLSVVSGPAAVVANADGSHTVTATDSGVVVLRATQGGNDSFIPAEPVLQTWVVNGKPQTVRFSPPAAATYGEGPFLLGADSDASAPGHEFPISFEVVSGPALIAQDGRTLHLQGAGTVILRAGQVGGGGVSPAFVTRILRVAKAPLHVAAKPTRRLVGQADPDFELTYRGFVNDDSEPCLEQEPVARPRAKKSSPQGEYPIVISGGRDSNYQILPESPAGLLTVVGFGGSYEALIGDSATGEPVAKLSLTLARNSLAVTGTLTLHQEGRTLALRGEGGEDDTNFEQTYGAASTAALAAKLSASGERVAYLVWFTLRADGTMEAELRGGPVQPDGVFDSHYFGKGEGRRLYAGRSAPWAGAYTMLFPEPRDADLANAARHPLGAAWATARIDARGQARLVGKLGDGSPLTAALQVDEQGILRLAQNPYGVRPGAYFTGPLALSALDSPAQTGRFHVAYPETEGPRWRKPAAAAGVKADALYPAGFGPLRTKVAVDPWLPPLRGGAVSGRVSLAARLGLVEKADGTAELVFDHGAGDYGALSEALPPLRPLTPAGAALPPVPNPAAWSLRIHNLNTGAFSGGFVLRDAGRVRKVRLEGVARQAALPEAEPLLGAGFLLLEPAGQAEGATRESHEIRLSAAAD